MGSTFGMIAIVRNEAERIERCLSAIAAGVTLCKKGYPEVA